MAWLLSNTSLGLTAVSHWPLAEEPHVLPWNIRHDICGGQSGFGTGLSQSTSALSFQYQSNILDTNLIRTSKKTQGAFQQRNTILDIGEHVKHCSPLERSSLLPLALLSSAAAFFLASAKRFLMEDESATDFIFASFGLTLSRPKAF